MNSITKSKAIFGVVAIAVIAIGFFVYMPTIKDGISASPIAAFAYDGGGGDGGCCGNDNGGGDNRDDDNDYVQPVRPICALDLSPNQITKDGTATLTWSTRNAVSASFNHFGDVALNGSRVISPDQDRTYILTVKGRNGQTVDCKKSITIKETPVELVPRCDNFTVTPSNVTGGRNVTLRWATTNATRVIINEGIGEVSPDGSRTVFVDESTTFRLAAHRGAQTDVCEARVVVDDEPENLSCDYLRVNDSSVEEGDQVTLSWATTGATSARISGIGSVPVDGSENVRVFDDTTYVLTATRANKTVTCDVHVNVEEEEEDDLSCDFFRVSDSSVEEGDEVELSWGTTGATSVRINQGIGSVSHDGEEEVRVYDDTTYTLTASRGSREVNCSVRVNVDEDDDNDDRKPQCVFFRVSDKNIEEGDSVRLSWETRRGSRLEIEDNRGREIFDTSDDDDVEEGSKTIHPTRDTRYTLTVWDNDNDKDTCSVSVEVEDDKDDVTITTIRDREPITSIVLTQVPYTGFDAGPMLTTIFYTLLALWSLGVAYVIFIKRGSVLGLSLGRKEVLASAAVAPAFAPMLTNSYTPVATLEEEETEEAEEVEENTAEGYGEAEEMSALENHAARENVMLSKDALSLIVKAGTTLEERVTLLDTVITRAKATLARENGWISLNREAVAKLFA